MGSPFDVLGISETADEDEIHLAYRERIKETHPDRGGSIGEFLEVRAAYEAILSDGEVTYDSDLESADAGTTTVTYLNYEVVTDHGWSLSDPALFEKAAELDLPPADGGTITVARDRTLLEAAESAGFTWPYACRGGACANCAVAVTAGELSMPPNHVIPERMLDDGVRLSCVGYPVTDELRLVFNVKHKDELEELRLPARSFGEPAMND